MVSNLLGILRKRLSLRRIMANKYFGSVKGVRLEPQYMPRSLMYVGWGLGVRMPKQISSAAGWCVNFVVVVVVKSLGKSKLNPMHSMHSVPFV